MRIGFAEILGRIFAWLRNIFSILVERDHPLRYFLPGKIILNVEHPEGLTRELLAADISAFLEQSGDERPWTAQLVPPAPEEILIFPLRDDQGRLLSIVPVQLRNDKATHEEMVELLLAISDGLPEGPLRISNNDVTLNSVTPDWLVSTVHHAGHPPSPGSWPLPAIPQQDADWSFRLDNMQDLPFAMEKGSQVHVAILDTAPTAAQFDEAYRKWPTHRLLERLWGSNRKLDLHTNIRGGLELMDTSPVGHGYLMPDHGLFVAGIINAIAPEATLHLIKVFTSLGSASTTTITQGILEILGNPEIGRPLIINCSFALSIDENSHLPGQIQGMIIDFERLFSRLAEQEDVLIVAAAGNYLTRIGTGRPEASYPAAFDGVIGVGALSKGPSIRVASYSNLADRPPQAGYMALGGEPGVGNGVLGIYTTELPVYAEGCLGRLLRILTLGLLGWKGAGHLPPNPFRHTINHVHYRPNTTGWAWWAGTSFAAPIVSGILAKWCSQQNSTGGLIDLAGARQTLTDMSQTITTDQNEPMILLEQG